MSSVRKSSRCLDFNKKKLKLILSSCDLAVLNLSIKVTDDIGRGVFATKDLQKNEPVCEYVGERLTAKQAKERFNEIGDTGDIYIYLFCIHLYIFMFYRFCLLVQNRWKMDGHRRNIRKHNSSSQID